MSLDLTIWLLILVSALLLVTIELTEDYLDRGWPRLHRPANGWVSSEGLRAFWMIVGGLVFPGIVLLLLNLALLAWRNLSASPVLVLGAVLIGIGWLVYLVLVSQIGGLEEYFQSLGLTFPLAVSAIVLLADLLLLIAFLSAMPDVSLRQLLP